MNFDEDYLFLIAVFTYYQEEKPSFICPLLKIYFSYRTPSKETIYEEMVEIYITFEPLLNLIWRVMKFHFDLPIHNPSIK